MTLATVWSFVRARLGEHKAQLRYCLRLTLAGLLAFGLVQFWHFPLHGLWAVLTAIVVTQMSIGGSLLATAEYVVGTLCGAIYASAIDVLVPHTTMPALTAALALSIAPLALLAALNSKFRVAPFTAVIVLFVSSEFRQSPFESAIYRVLEVMLGGGSAIVVSVLILPERAHARALEAAARILERLAEVLPALLAGFTRSLDADTIARPQNELGAAITAFQAIAAEIKSERLTSFVTESDHGPLSRTLLRLRHDLVIIGRAAAAPLPDPFAKRLAPLLTRIGESIGDDLRASAAALSARRPPPSLQAVDAACAAYGQAFAALRQEDFTRTLDAQEVERVFALGFALEQLRQNLADLHRCVSESAGAEGQGDAEG
ncbi:MAG: FUSC family protein [Beijerinckiaceae bacterium]